MFILLSPCSSLSQFLCVLFFWWFSFSPFLHVRQRAMISSTSGWPSCVRIVYLGKTRQWVSNVASFMLCPWARAPCQPWPLSPRKTELRSVEIPAQVNVTLYHKTGKKNPQHIWMKLCWQQLPLLHCRELYHSTGFLWYKDHTKHYGMWLIV